jgi:diacylglycerol kinase (ATP)
MKKIERKIIYLINPIAGAFKRGDIKKIIEHESAKAKLLFEILHTNPTGDYSSLKQKIIDEKITDVIIVGGDGTVNQVTNSLKELPIQFGIIPTGSGNGLAFAANIPKNPKAALQIIFKNEAKLVDAFLINNQYSCMLSGLGFDAQVAHDFAEKSTRGLATYAVESAANFLKAEPYKFQITINNFSFTTEAFFISIANSNQFGNHFTIAPQASLSDGLLDIVIVKKNTKLKLLVEVWKQIKGENKLSHHVNSLSNHIIYFQTANINIKNIGLAPLHIDGEPQPTAEEFEIKIMPDSFKLLQ